MKFLTEYETVSSKEYGDAFVGMNSGNGFIGSYSDVINEDLLERLYIIKGAPGTGKSTFMKMISSSAAMMDIPVKRFVCSSDISSIDAVILNNKIAVIDGTLPHAYEMKYPGSVSEIIDVTRFWDTEALASDSEEIKYHTKRKSSFYNEAYNNLSAYNLLQNERYRKISKVIDKDKISGMAERLIKSFGRSKSCGINENKILCSIGMAGRYRLDTLDRDAKRIITVADINGSAYIFMDMIDRYLSHSEWSYTTSRDPINPGLLCDIYIEEIQTLITVSEQENNDKIINMNRFIDVSLLSAIRGNLRLSNKCGAVFMTDALASLQNAGNEHFSLERIYSAKMDFDSLNAYFKLKESEIINRLS